MVDGVCLNAGNRDGAAVPSHIAIESGDGGSVIAPWDPQVAEDALAIANLNTDLREFIFRVPGKLACAYKSSIDFARNTRPSAAPFAAAWA